MWPTCYVQCCNKREGNTHGTHPKYTRAGNNICYSRPWTLLVNVVDESADQFRADANSDFKVIYLLYCIGQSAEVHNAMTGITGAAGS